MCGWLAFASPGKQGVGLCLQELVTFIILSMLV